VSTIVQEPVTAPAQPELDEETRRVLQDARRILLERGWCRQIRMDADGRVCLVGAIEVAMHGSVRFNHTHGNTYKAADDILGPFGIRDAAEWNDDPSRTKAEVIDLFDRLLG
jgi:hypothetical protein